MKRNSRLLNHYWKVSLLMTALGALTMFLLDYNKANPTYANIWPWLLDILDTLQKQILWIAIPTVFLWIVWQIKLKGMKDWGTIIALLGFIRGRVFKRFNGDANHLHRVTLFEFVRVHWQHPLKSIKHIWPWSAPNQGWLIPICRSGHLSLQSNAKFEVGDHKYEGICGSAWVSESVKVATNLPCVTRDCITDAISTYASATGCTEEFVVRKKDDIKASEQDTELNCLARSVGAIPLRIDEYDSCPKYVLVLDSRREDGVPEDVSNQYTVAIQLLTKLLGELK